MEQNIRQGARVQIQGTIRTAIVGERTAGSNGIWEVAAEDNGQTYDLPAALLTVIG
ncbi:MAG: hypothetical protein HOY79_33760 [Streptomyces sp.]|nr:hypothetical protein [Streptomyces sp.]NUS11341.1 hypothetical protein [Streptomyces sp.]NUS23384.1 hypothetical protein [Streptomyces sp.]